MIFLLPFGSREPGDLLEKVFREEGIEVYNSRKLVSVSKEGDDICLFTEDGICLKAEKLLLAAGRKVDLTELNLDNAGVKYNDWGIKVDKKYRTSVKHIYAVGDCNNQVLLSHAAMHQGMFALMNAVSPFIHVSVQESCDPLDRFSRNPRFPMWA